MRICRGSSTTSTSLPPASVRSSQPARSMPAHVSSEHLGCRRPEAPDLLNHLCLNLTAYVPRTPERDFIGLFLKKLRRLPMIVPSCAGDGDCCTVVRAKLCKCVTTVNSSAVTACTKPTIIGPCSRDVFCRLRSNVTEISAKVKQQLSGVIPEDVVDKDTWSETVLDCNHLQMLTHTFEACFYEAWSWHASMCSPLALRVL